MSEVLEVIVYIKSPEQEKEQGFCVQCAAIKRKLPSLGVEWRSEFLDSPEAQAVVARAIEQGKQSAPITQVLYADGSERLIAGNNLPAIKEALNV